MKIGLKCSGIWTEIGDKDVLNAFFSTICYRLESNRAGSRYPNMQNKLNYGSLEPDDIPSALAELEDIRKEFMSLKPEDVVWDSEDLNKKAPQAFFRQPDASNLSECFITQGRRNYFDVFTEVLEFSKNRLISVNFEER